MTEKLELLNVKSTVSNNTWQRPKTTRRYLHPPRSERMFTLWAEGKIVFGENDRCVDASSYRELDCTVICPVHTKHARAFDFRRAQNHITEDGTPIHGITHEFGGFSVEIEAFCNTERLTSCFSRVTVTNTASHVAREKLGFVIRSGKEKELVYGAPDCYISYMPEISALKSAPVSFSENDGILRNEDVFIKTISDMPYAYDENQGILWFDLEMKAYTQKQIVFCIGKGDSFNFDYDAERAKCEMFWQTELSRIKYLPRALDECPEHSKMIRHLVAQILQCFYHLVGEKALLHRQGGLQRLIWPWESKPVLEALGMIGDFSDYIEPVLSFYFDEMQSETGEVRALGENWASITASALYSLATYAVQKNDVEYWHRYRDAAMRALLFIHGKRQESRLNEGDVPGLFPSLRGNDRPVSLQHWTNTDCWAVFALEALSLATHYFEDDFAERVDAELSDYRKTIRDIFDNTTRDYEGKDELRIPLTPTGDDETLLSDFYPYLLQAPFTYLFLTSDEAVRVHRWLARRGIIDEEHALHGHMLYRDGNTHIWYTSTSDRYWFLNYMRMGDREAAKRTIIGQIRYSMTDEYYMQERYCDNDPYFVPWSPNASASGRLILMLLEYYADNKETSR